MIICLVAWHVKQVDDNEYDWGYPVGAMALIATAVSSRAFLVLLHVLTSFLQVERALTLSKTGTLPDSKTATQPQGSKKEKRDNSKQFSEANWGDKARTRYKQAKGISPALWNVIETEARAICNTGDVEVVGDEAGTASSEAGYEDEVVAWDW